MKTSDAAHELFLNYACNAKCPFCYNPPITPELLRRELSFEAAAASLYAGAKSGARRLNLHGGEVTLRDDLPKILALARKLGFTHITVVTNGVRLAQPGYAASLVECGATDFRISIHAAKAEVHDALLALPGAFDKAVRGLEELRRLEVGTGLNYVLVRSNLGELAGCLDRFVIGGWVEDAIVYYPHRRGMMALNSPSAPTYAEAAAAVRVGAEGLRSAGHLAKLYLGNFVPCVLPELKERMLDWELDGAAAVMTNPEEKTADVVAEKRSHRVKVRGCASCVLSARCAGIEPEAVSASGESCFVALQGAAA